VYEVLVKCGQSVCRCGLEEAGDRRSLEIPTWMFEPAACGRLRLTTVPIVGCDALLELKAVLRAAQRPDHDGVLQAEHRSWLVIGGADATLLEPSTALATDSVSPSPAASAISDISAGHPREDDSAVVKPS